MSQSSTNTFDAAYLTQWQMPAQSKIRYDPAWRYADCLRVGDVYALAEAVKEEQK